MSSTCNLYVNYMYFYKIFIHWCFVLFILDTVTFDNSYSLLRSKTLHYCVYVTHSVTKITETLSLENTLEDKEDLLRNESNSVSNENNCTKNANTAKWISYICIYLMYYRFIYTFLFVFRWINMVFVFIRVLYLPVHVPIYV